MPDDRIKAKGDSKPEATEKVPKRLVIGSPKGGCGKTSTARNLAVAAATDGFTVATMDLDPQNTLTQWFERRPDQAVEITNFTASLDDVGDIESIAGFDLLIIDTPPLVTSGIRADSTEGVNERDREMLRNLRMLVSISDFVLAPTFQQEEDIASNEVWMKALRQLGKNSASLLSATNRRTKSFEEAKRRLIHVGRLCPIDIPRVEDIPASTKLGLGVVEISKAKGSEDFRAVWSYVRGELGL